MKSIRPLFLITLIFLTYTAFCQILNDSTLNSPKPFVVAEIDGIFPNGYIEWIKILKDSIKYPEKARDLNIQGKIIAEFKVNNNGSIYDINIIHGIGGGCDEEVIRVLKLMPKLKPSTQNGITMPIQCQLPLNFILPQNPDKKAKY